jgi:hypothetical protein
VSQMLLPIAALQTPEEVLKGRRGIDGSSKELLGILVQERVRPCERAADVVDALPREMLEDRFLAEAVESRLV